MHRYGLPFDGFPLLEIHDQNCGIIAPSRHENLPGFFTFASLRDGRGRRRVAWFTTAHPNRLMSHQTSPPLSTIPGPFSFLQSISIFQHFELFVQPHPRSLGPRCPLALVKIVWAWCQPSATKVKHGVARNNGTDEDEALHTCHCQQSHDCGSYLLCVKGVTSRVPRVTTVCIPMAHKDSWDRESHIV